MSQRDMVVVYPDMDAGSTDTTRGVSEGSIWKDCNVDRLLRDFTAGTAYIGKGGPQDIGRWTLVDVTPVGAAVATLTALDADGGANVLTSGSTTPYEGGMAYLGAGGFGEFLKVPSSGKLWYEARVKVSQIATANGLFIGLGQIDTGAAVATSFMVSGELVNQGIGFKTPITASAILQSITQNSTAESGNSEITTGVHTLVADTYVKLGFVVDTYISMSSGTPVSTTRVKFYVNGVVAATHTTKVPTTELTCVMAALGSVTSSVSTALTWDWVQAAVEYNVGGAS